MRNRFAALRSDEEDATERYSKFIQANSEAAEKLIPKRGKRGRKQTADHPKIIEAREETQEAFRKYQNLMDTESEEEWRSSKQKVQTIYREIEEEELNALIQEVERADEKSKHGESWKLINSLTGRKIGRQGDLKGKTKEDRLNSWHKHFQSLLGKDPVRAEEESTEMDPVRQNIHVGDGNFTPEELKKAKKSLKDGKQAGPDNIPPEVLKN